MGKPPSYDKMMQDNLALKISKEMVAYSNAHTFVYYVLIDTSFSSEPEDIEHSHQRTAFSVNSLITQLLEDPYILAHMVVFADHIENNNIQPRLADLDHKYGQELDVVYKFASLHDKVSEGILANAIRQEFSMAEQREILLDIEGSIYIHRLSDFKRIGLKKSKFPGPHQKRPREKGGKSTKKPAKKLKKTEK